MKSAAGVFTCLSLILIGALLGGCAQAKTPALFIYTQPSSVLFAQFNVNSREIDRVFYNADYDLEHREIEDADSVAEFGPEYFTGFPLVIAGPGLGAAITSMLDKLDGNVRLLYLGETPVKDVRLVGTLVLPDIADPDFRRQISGSPTGSWLLYSGSFLEENYSAESVSNLLGLFSPQHLLNMDGSGAASLAELVPPPPTDKGESPERPGAFILADPLQIGDYISQFNEETHIQVFAAYISDDYFLAGGFPLDPLVLLFESLQEIETSDAREIVVYLPFRARK